jgi:hypothetical protein
MMGRNYDVPVSQFNERKETSISVAAEYALGDVVESAPPGGLGFDLDRNVEHIGCSERVTARIDVNYHQRHKSNHKSDDESDDEYPAPRPPDTARARAQQTDDINERDGVDERRQLLELDRLERRAFRQRTRRERRERRALRTAQAVIRRRQRAPRRTRFVDAHHQRADNLNSGMRRIVNIDRKSTRHQRAREVPIDDHRGANNDPDMATHSGNVRRGFATRVHGAALVLYFVLLPYVVMTKWRLTSLESHGSLVRVLLVLLGVFWVAFLAQVVVNVWRLKQGRRVNNGGSAWLAGLVVTLLALLAPTSHPGLREPVAISTPYHEPTSSHTHGPASPASSLGAIPLALQAKRRGDVLRHGDDDTDDLDVDESIALLRERRPELIAYLVERCGDAIDGVIDVSEISVTHVGPTGVAAAPVVVCALGPSTTGTLLSFAREGGRLTILPSWSEDDVVANVVALHDGRVHFARSEPELLRLLATRTLRESVVVYLGNTSTIDNDLVACAVTLSVSRDTPNTRQQLVPKTPRLSDVRVELLRADPQVVGLVEPFTPTLRRRCVEMVSYLALHRHEPITGERLRTRVLTHADIDASLRTLTNTASAVRRSLGVNDEGPRLHPVTSSGLYVTHGLSSDVELFSTLVARARQLNVADAAPLAHQALLLIKGEPLASALRGFEWFLAEGHGARLARDGEWAALALHHNSMKRHNYELAFWALQQGRLIDPYSDALADALARVPRLREFGSDGSSGAKDEAVSPGGAVAMSWAFTRFSQQVTQ